MRKSAAHAAVLWTILICQPALADDVSWDRAANMKQAGRELAGMWAEKAAPGIFKHIEACHREHVLQAAEYTREAETCVVQDVVHSHVSASMYARLSEEARKMSGSPKAETVLLAMKKRLKATARKFGFSNAEIGGIAKLGFETAAPVYFETLKEHMAAARNRRAGR
ncbi:MAG: hypothetical protein ACLFV8_02765 [Alphaproteobacteria bacterium]